MEPLSYSMEEAREILLDQAINLEDHIYLEGRREEYVRAEDYDRPAILQSCFRFIWSTTHPDWSWEEELPADTPAAYYSQRDAVYHWFRANARIRGGFKRLPGEVEKTKWTAEDVCGNIYKSAILEWVEAKSGFIPGYADGFLAQYRQARSKLFKCLSADQVRACERTAEQWNGVSVPRHVQVQNFNNKFASVCRAFTNMLVKDYGVFPFVFYIGVPGHDVPAGLYEVMRKEGLAAQTFRSFSKLDGVFRDMRSYVNMNIDTLYRADAKRPPPVRSAEHLKCAEYEFRREDIVGNRVYLFEDRVKEGWEDNSAHLFYQIIQFCHSIITSSKQTPPPWKALSEDASRLILQICLLGGSVRFGSSPEKTLRDHRNALIKHWFQLGYLEFHHRSVRGGTSSEPDVDRWHALSKYDKDFTEQWLSNERTARGHGPPVSVPTPTGIGNKFGSGGPCVTLPDNSPYSWEPRSEQDESPYRQLPDPGDLRQHAQTTYRPGRPSWPAPRLSGPTIYARVQWSSQLLAETGGKAAATLLEAVTWLSQLPPVANYDYDIAFFRRQDGKDRTWAVDSLPDWVGWTLDRSNLESQAEVDSLAGFLKAKSWSFEHNGKSRFAGVEMAWTIALSAILYVRAIRHQEETSANPPSRWSLSGNLEWQRQSREYSFGLDREAVRTIVYEFRCYVEDLALSMPVTGLPPSLLYVGHSSREEYVLSHVRLVPRLLKLFELVVKMPVHGEEAYPSCKLFSARPVWQQPQVGVPRAAHKEETSKSTVLAACNNPTLFVKADGSSRGGEAGLSALLELVLIWAEADRMCGDQQFLPVYLRSSPWLQGLDGLKEELLVAAANHSVALEHALSNRLEVTGQKKRKPVKPSPYGTGGSQYLGRHSIDVDAQLRAHQRTTNEDTLLSRVRDSTMHEKDREGRWKVNEIQRRDQNSKNFAAHQTIHPTKPASSSLILPDLEAVHEPLRYTAGSSVTSQPPAASKKHGRRGGRALISQQEAPRPHDGAPESVPLRAADGPGKTYLGHPGTASASASGSDVIPRKRRAEELLPDSDSQPSRRRRIRLTSEDNEGSEHFKVPLFLASPGSQEHSDDELPLQISTGRGPSSAAAAMSGEMRTGRLATPTALEARSVAAAHSPAPAPARSESTAESSLTAPMVSDLRASVPPPLPPPRPRPRRKNSQLARSPGFSTAF